MAENVSASDDDWATLLGTGIHIWRLRVDVRDTAFDHFDSVLSEAERERAQRFRFARLRQEFTIAHGGLRVLLGRYLSVAAERVRFADGSHGKPAIAEPSSTIRFNLSHSGQLAVIAIGHGRDLGVDVEEIRPMSDMQEIARRFFSHEEAADLLRTAPDAHEQNFFRIWTRKEAFIKAIGHGLSFPLDSFAVSFRPDDDARLVHLRGESDAARGWQLHAFEPAPGFAGALAYQGSRVTPRLFPLLAGDALTQAIAANPAVLTAQELV